MFLKCYYCNFPRIQILINVAINDVTNASKNSPSSNNHVGSEFKETKHLHANVAAGRNIVLGADGTGDSILFFRQNVVQVPDVVAGFIESSRVELQTNDGEYNDGEEK